MISWMDRNRKAYGSLKQEWFPRPYLNGFFQVDPCLQIGKELKFNELIRIGNWSGWMSDLGAVTISYQKFLGLKLVFSCLIKLNCLLNSYHCIQTIIPINCALQNGFPKNRQWKCADLNLIRIFIPVLFVTYTFKSASRTRHRFGNQPAADDDWIMVFQFFGGEHG